jgi:hypothetical protein
MAAADGSRVAIGSRANVVIAIERIGATTSKAVRI